MRRLRDMLDDMEFVWKGIVDEFMEDISPEKVAYATLTAMAFLFLLSVVWMPFLIAPALAAALSVPLSMWALRSLKTFFNRVPTRVLAFGSAFAAGLINCLVLLLVSAGVNASVPLWALAVSAILAFIWMLWLVIRFAGRHHGQFQTW